MNPNDPNVVLLELVARRLGEVLREELVFVGGLLGDAASQARAPDLEEKLRQLAGLA